MKHVGIVIVNYNSSNETLACLESLLQLKIDTMSLNIILIDNASKKADKENLQKNLPKTNDPFSMHFIESKENTGFSGGYNQGMRYALKTENDYIILLNSDTLVDKDLITNLCTAAENHKKAGIIVPKIYFAKGYEFHKSRYEKKDLGKVIWFAGGKIDWKNVIGEHRGVDEVDSGQYDTESSIEFASGCCFLIKPEVVKQVGMFDERYFLYFEDADLCLRVKKAGYSILYNPRAFLWHKNAGSTGGSGSSLQDYYMTRNRLLFGMTYAPMRAKVALLRWGWKIRKCGREWERKGADDFFKKRFGKGSYRV